MDQRRGQRRGAALHRLRPASDPRRAQAAQNRLPPPLRKAQEDSGRVRECFGDPPHGDAVRGIFRHLEAARAFVSKEASCKRHKILLY